MVRAQYMEMRAQADPDLLSSNAVQLQVGPSYVTISGQELERRSWRRISLVSMSALGQIDSRCCFLPSAMAKRSRAGMRLTTLSMVVELKQGVKGVRN